MTDNIQIKPRLKVGVVWVIKEKVSGRWVPKVERRNIVTNYGLTAFASAPSGNYLAPINLVINTAGTTLTQGYGSGISTISTAADPTVTGDTQLTLGTGLADQEVVTFTGKSGTGPFSFTLSPATVNPHGIGELVTRTPRIVDTLASVLSEAQYDPTYFAGKRAIQTANYSPGTGQNTMQFFIAGIQATNLLFAQVGLSENNNVGQGNLHNLSDLGYLHNSTNDLEIDVTWTITTS